MSVSMGSIVMTIRAIDEASGVMGKISASLGLVGAQLEQLGPGFSQVGQVIQGFAVGGPTGAVITGLGVIAKGLQDSVVAAGNMQTALVGVQSVLHLTGAAWDAASLQIQTGIDKIRQATTQSDLDLTNSMQVLLTYGMSTAQALDALNAATDIAAAKHIDLSTAATALGKAFQGNSMLLVRYGIDVATVAKQTGLGTEAIKELGVNLAGGTTSQLSAFGDAMTHAGLAVADASGKMMGHAAVLKEIETAWKAGTISGDQLSTIVGALGINFQGSKALAMDYANVLAQVNTQYGGAAQAQAQTYAGAQERLANAMQVMGEKLGAILLPALASMTEALIPIVDWLTQGVEKVQAWIDAFTKMPAVKGIFDSINTALFGTEQATGAAGAAVDAYLKSMGSFGTESEKINTYFKSMGDNIDEFTGGLREGYNVSDAFVIGLENATDKASYLSEALKKGQISLEGYNYIVSTAKDALSPTTELINKFETAIQGVDLTHITSTAKTLAEQMDKLGLSTKDTSGATKDFGPLVQTLVDSFQSGKIDAAAFATAASAIGVSFDSTKQAASGFAGIIPTLQGLWDGLTKSFNDAWDSVKGGLLPAFQALQDAFNQLMTALQPLWDAFNELWHAITGSGGDFNIFKAILEGIVLVVKGLADIIRFVTPAIHLLAEAFKAAADFIVPILEAIRNALGAFFKWLTDSFQGFYDWLVGHSLWQDLWTEVLSVTTQAATNLLNVLTGGFFGKVQDAFQQAVTAVQTTWSNGLTGLSTQAANSMFAVAQTIQDEQPRLAGIFNSIGLMMEGKWADAFGVLGRIAQMTLEDIGKTFHTFIDTMKSDLDTAWSDMQQGAASAMSTLQSLVSGAMSAIAKAANDLWNTLTHHSIWPNMMAEMLAQTKAGMAAVQGEFTQGFAGPTGIIPTLQTGGQAAAGAVGGQGAAPAAPSSSQAITLPISVYLDGQQIQTFLEKRIVSTLYRDASRGKRGPI